METEYLPPYLRSAFNSKCLAKDEEARLFAEYKNDKHNAAKGKIFNAHLRLVVIFAKRFSRAQPDLFHDLLNEGSIALLKAIDQFDPRRGFRFSTFASKIIQGSIARYSGEHCNDSILIPEEIRLLARRVQRITDHLAAVGEGVTDERLMAEADLTPKQLRRVRGAERAMRPDRMDAPLVDGHDGVMRQVDSMTDGSPSPEENAILVDTRDRVQAIVRALPERDRALIKARYEKVLTNTAIGEQLDRSRNWVAGRLGVLHDKFRENPVVQALA